MIKLIATVMLTVLATVALASTDYQCVNDCTQNGYMYQLCQAKCSYNDSTSAQLQPSISLQAETPYQQTQTDYQCVNDCTNAGYMYGLCKKRCSY